MRRSEKKTFIFFSYHIGRVRICSLNFVAHKKYLFVQPDGFDDIANISSKNKKGLLSHTC